jgi:hypothetical protein
MPPLRSLPAPQQVALPKRKRPGLLLNPLDMRSTGHTRETPLRDRIQAALSPRTVQ